MHSYRLTEAMRANAIPVIVADGYVLPFAELLDWSQMAIFVPESEWRAIPDILRAIPDEQVARMRRLLVDAYENHFASTRKIVDTILQIVQRRIYAHSFLGRPANGIPVK